MAKFVCDFDAVQNYIAEIDGYINELDGKISEYDKSLEGNLVGWTGEAKQKFLNSHSTKVANLKNVSAQLKKLNAFLSDSVAKINEEESRLASLTI